MQNQTRSPDSAPKTVNSEKISRVAVNAFFRPMMSAIEPQANAPTAIPMRLEVPTQAA